MGHLEIGSTDHFEGISASPNGGQARAEMAQIHHRSPVRHPDRAPPAHPGTVVDVLRHRRRRQWTQVTTLTLELGAHQPVAPVGDSPNELPVLFLRVEVPAAPEYRAWSRAFLRRRCLCPATPFSCEERGLVLVASTMRRFSLLRRRPHVRRWRPGERQSMRLDPDPDRGFGGRPCSTKARAVSHTDRLVRETRHQYGNSGDRRRDR